MKNTILILSLLVFSLQAVAAQKSSDRTFKDKTWYGAHIALGFGASSSQSAFTLGIAPMAGYRILDPISIGPRASILYRHLRFLDFSGNLIQKINIVDKGIGAFIRAEVYRQYFAQIELMYESTVNQIANNGDQIRVKGANAYIGIGTNIGGRNPSIELMVTYDLNLQAIRKSDLINFRFGFTINY